MRVLRFQSDSVDPDESGPEPGPHSRVRMAMLTNEPTPASAAIVVAKTAATAIVRLTRSGTLDS